MDFDEAITPDLLDHGPVADPYLLPRHVACNIPRYPMSNAPEPSSFNHARGELMESCRLRDGRPVALLVSYVLLYDVSLSTVIDSRFRLPNGDRVRVETEFRRYWDTNSEWSVTVNGKLIASEVRVVPPHPRVVGSIVHAALNATGSPDPPDPPARKPVRRAGDTTSHRRASNRPGRHGPRPSGELQC